MELICNFSSNCSLLSHSSIYVCSVVEVSRIASNGRVINIIGEHDEGKSNADVTAVQISGVQLDYYPRYLCKYFPNLKSILILSGGLKKLSKFDFIGHEGIEKLMLIDNNIPTIDNDIFDYAPNIESISLFKNSIKFIGDKVFDKMKKLRYVNLKFNNSYEICLKQEGNGLKTLKELKDAIKVATEKQKKKELLKEETQINEKSFNEALKEKIRKIDAMI